MEWWEKKYNNILVKKENHIATVTVNRPPMNPINWGTVLELDEAFYGIKYDNDVRVSIITGTGDRAFSAGLDVKAWGARREGKLQPGDAETKPRPMIFPRHADESSAIYKTGKPSIAMVNGVAAGVGADWITNADLAIASENARATWAYIKRGLYPVEGATWLLPRIVGLKKAMELVVFGDIIDAQEMLRLGIVNKVVPQDQLYDVTMEWADRLANKTSPSALGITRHLVYTGLNQSYLDHLNSMESAGRAINRDHTAEAMRAWLEKRAPVFD